MQTYPSYVEDFLNDMKFEGKEDSTIQRYAYDLAEFLNWLENNELPTDKKALMELDKDELMDFIKFLSEEKELAWVTVKRKLSVLNQLFSFLQVKDSFLSSESIESIRKEKPLTKSDFVSENEYNQLVQSIYSKDDLTEHEKKTRDLLVDRNASIIMLCYKYGLSLQEVVNIDMQDVSFIQNTIKIPCPIGTRTINLSQKDKVLLYTYLTTIPEPVRPKDFTEQPLFVAVDFNRQTFRWVYEDDSPKRIHGRSIQKMLRKEVQRAGLKHTITVQSFRNGYILNKLKQGKSIDYIQKELGLKTNISLRRFQEYYLSVKNMEIA